MENLVGLPVRRSIVGVAITDTLQPVYNVLLARYGKEFADDYCLGRKLNFRAADCFSDALVNYENLQWNG